jgi:hypothetical protein
VCWYSTEKYSEMQLCGGDLDGVVGIATRYGLDGPVD